MHEIINSIVTGLQESIKNDYLVTFIISMIPTIEVRGAIPIAIQMGIQPVIAYLFACISALVVIPILVVVLKPLINWLKRTKIFKSLGNALEEMFRGKAQKIENKAELKAEELEKESKKKTFYKMLGLFAFVAIPLPATGVWTGTTIALFMNMDLKKSMISLVFGNFFAGAIITIMTVLLGENSYIILLVLLAFVIITVLSIGMSLILKRRKNNLKTPDNAVIYTDKNEDEQK
ncbi:MAG: COG2426 family protein [Bacillota bacterium]